MQRPSQLPMMGKFYPAHSAKIIWQRGFTLIEVLVTLVIVSVAILALGGFSLGVVSSGQVDRERLTAIHLAEQVMEFWQNDANNYAPQVSTACVLSASAVAPSYPVSPAPSCKPSSGFSISYTINIEAIGANAPLPTDPNANNSNSGSFAVRAMIGGAASTPTIKIVTVSWAHKGKSRSVYLSALVVPK